jgi:hypothetical protein
MNIEVITQPTVEPVTAAEAFFHLKLTTSPSADVSSEPQLAEVQRCIASSRTQCEQITRRAFVRQTLRMTMGPMRSGERRGLQWYMNGGSDTWQSVELLRPPFIEMVQVRYYDDDNVLQTVTYDEEVPPVPYYVSSGLVPKLCFTDAFTHPSVYLRDDAIQIDYVAGYPIIEADPEEDPPIVEDLIANVPASIKQAILLGVQLEFEKLTPQEREAIEKARDSLLSSFRVATY